MTFDVNQYFQSYRAPTWMVQSPAVPQEEDIGSVEIQPTGWVINSSDNVIIDDEGLHVLDGSIFITDDSGESVLTSSGFGGSWSDFIHSGLYNSRFLGPLGAVSVSLVNQAHGSDYELSLNPNLHQWVVSEIDANTDLTLDQDITGRQFLQFHGGGVAGSGSEFVEIFQDIPIRYRTDMSLIIKLEAISDTGPTPTYVARVRTGVSFLNADKSVETAVSWNYGTYHAESGLGIVDDPQFMPSVADENWAFIRIRIRATEFNETDPGSINLYGARLVISNPRVRSLILDHNGVNDNYRPFSIYNRTGDLYVQGAYVNSRIWFADDDGLAHIGIDVGDGTLQFTTAGWDVGGGVSEELALVPESADVLRLDGGSFKLASGSLFFASKEVKYVDVNLPAGGTTFIPDADISQVGSALVASNGNNGSGVISWYRAGTFNLVNGMSGNPGGPWEFRGSTFSAGAGFFSFFIESNLAGARLAIKNNAGFATSVRMLVF